MDMNEQVSQVVTVAAVQAEQAIRDPSPPSGPVALDSGQRVHASRRPELDPVERQLKPPDG